jgi:HK97 gp10 family phage protein
MPKWTDKVQREDFERMVMRGLTAVGAFLQGDAMVRCPVKTGRLKGSITWATTKSESRVRGPAKSGDGVSKPGDKYTCHIGSNVEYAQHVEYGTRRPTPAQPYLRPALDENKKEVRQIFQDYIKDMVRGK